jgi:hypothetical protein
VRQQRHECREKRDVERHDRAQKDDEAAHLSTVASGFALQIVAERTRFH